MTILEKGTEDHTPEERVDAHEESEADAVTSSNPTCEPNTQVEARTTKTKSDFIVTSITEALADVLRQLNSDQDILKLGVGLGMSLGAQGILTWNENNSTIENRSSASDSTTHQVVDEADEPLLEDVSNESTASNTRIINESDQLMVAPMHNYALADEATSHLLDEDESLDFDIENDDEVEVSVCKIDKTNIRNITDIAVHGFLDNVNARRVGKQYINYIESTPNLPESKPVGRVKPRSAGKDWQAIGFDPWSAGKELLTIEFIPTLSHLPSQLEDVVDAFQDAGLSPMHDNARSILGKQRDKKEQMNIETFSRLCSCIRHGNFPELDMLLNEAEWKVSIDYTDDVGNTLLMICCQNGNKRMVKLCLRKGCALNKQNCNGHTCLHYAFGYGFGTCHPSLSCTSPSPT